MCRCPSTWSTVVSCRADRVPDQYVVLLRNTVTQMVYKHLLSTIVPGRAVNFSTVETAEGSNQ